MIRDFVCPSDDPSSVLSTYSYGLHLPLEPYARALRAIARDQIL